MTEWIKTSDKFPPYEICVLTYCPSFACDRIEVAFLNKDENCYEYWFVGHSADMHKNDVTHWMPLPKPPEE